jgi:hypothetical protein
VPDVRDNWRKALVKQSEKSRHIGGKPNTRNEADNRMRVEKKGKAEGFDKKGRPTKPKNADVGNVRKDR